MNTRQKPSVRIYSIDELLDEQVTREVLTSGVLAAHTADLSKFKNESGEFTRWLHIFHVANRPTFHDTNLKVTTVLPWCTPGNEIDPEFHRAVSALNGYADYPLAWKSFSWHLPPMETTPIYGVFTGNPSQHSMFALIKERTGIDPKHMGQGVEIVFWERMKEFVIVPRQDGELLPKQLRATKPTRSIVNANSGSGQTGTKPVRERRYGPSDWAAGLRQVAGDRARDHSDPE